MITTSNHPDASRGPLLSSNLIFEKAPERSGQKQPARQYDADASGLRQLLKQQAQAQGRQMD